MKFVFALFGAMAVVISSAQSIVSSFSHSGSVSVATQSVDYRYTRGGSPRSGYYWYWRQYTDQTTQQQQPIPVNGTTGLQDAIGTFYSPSYEAIGAGSTSFSNTSAAASFDVYLRSATLFSPKLRAHQGASVSSTASDTATFTVLTPTYLSVYVSGSNRVTARLTDITSGDVIFGGTSGGSFADTVDPGTYQLTTMLSSSAALNTQTGVFTNLGKNAFSASAHISFGPPR